MQYQIISVTAFEQNCSLVWCPQTQHCALVDPGGDPELLLNAMQAKQLQPQAIWLTHGHLDHVGATPTLAKQLNIPVYGPHEADKYWLDALPIQSQRFGLPTCPAFVPDHWLKHGDTLTLGQLSFNVLHTPGHTPGHVVLHNAEHATVFVGDVLFNGAVGRYDFPGGNHADLMNSIKSQLWPMADETVVVPGHGPTTTIGYERRYNTMVR